MSELPNEQDQVLAQVLNRINALITHAPAPDAPAPQSAEDLPVLTQVYQGVALEYAQRSAAELVPMSGQLAAPAAAPQQAADMLLAEMRPLIQSAVKEALQLELAQTEHILAARLEGQLLQAFEQRLQALSRHL